MKIISWLKLKWREEKTLTSMDLKKELELSENRFYQLLAIAKANDYNEKLWDKVFNESYHIKNIKQQIKKMEETNNE